MRLNECVPDKHAPLLEIGLVQERVGIRDNTQ